MLYSFCFLEIINIISRAIATPLTTLHKQYYSIRSNRTQEPGHEGSKCTSEAKWNYFNINCDSKLARIHMAGCHPAGLWW